MVMGTNSTINSGLGGQTYHEYDDQWQNATITSGTTAGWTASGASGNGELIIKKGGVRADISGYGAIYGITANDIFEKSNQVTFMCALGGGVQTSNDGKSGSGYIRLQDSGASNTQNILACAFANGTQVASHGAAAFAMAMVTLTLEANGDITVSTEGGNGFGYDQDGSGSSSIQASTTLSSWTRPVNIRMYVAATNSDCNVSAQISQIAWSDKKIGSNNQKPKVS